MRKIITILLTLSILLFMSGCVGISYYFQPDIDPNVIWKTKDGSVWFILDGESNSAGINNVEYNAGLNTSDRLGFSNQENQPRISFSCKFKRNKIIATVKTDKDNILGVGTVLEFYKHNINE